MTNTDNQASTPGPGIRPGFLAAPLPSTMRIILLLIFFSIALLSGLVAASHISRPLDSEHQAVGDSLAIAHGKSSYGMVDYTHYPNGPSYILLPFVAMGVNDLDALRAVPVFITAVAFTCALYALLFAAKNTFLGLWAFAGLLVLFLQPGVIGWAGRLHEFTYALSLTLILAVCGLMVRNAVPWFLGLGFVSAWIGYDWLPVQMTTAFVSRLLYYGQKESTSFTIKHSLKDALWAVSGAFAGILAHLVQNMLYYGEIRKALQDFFGAMGARMGLESADVLSSNYSKSLQKYTERALQVYRLDKFTLGIILRSMLELFKRHWVNWTYFFALIPFAIILLTNIGHYKAAFSKYKWLRLLSLLFVPLVLMFIGANIWFILVPYHAIHHFHFLPRHYYSLFIIAFLIPFSFHNLKKQDVHVDSDDNIFRFFAPSLSACGVTMGLLLALYAYALAA